MSDVPFGFGIPDRNPERRDQPGPGDDPFGLGALFGGAGGAGTPQEFLAKMPLFTELQKLMNWSGSPVKLDLARQGAIARWPRAPSPSPAGARSPRRWAGGPVAGPGDRPALRDEAPSPGPGRVGGADAAAVDHASSTH